MGTLLLIGIVTTAILACFAAVYIRTVILPDTYVDATAFSMNLSSTIYYTDAATGEYKELRTLHGGENRVLVSYDEIPQDLIDAAVAIEDQRFRTHHGVDWRRTAGAFLNMFIGMRDTYGGSTITQQLIKNMTENDEVTVKRKILEIFRALEFERNYSKEEILEMYLNYIYLGESCYGVGTASLTYFGKPVSQLTLAECASLIGITNNPSRYDPYISDYTREQNKQRQELILYEMMDQGYITQEEYDAAVAQELVFQRADEGSSSTAYTYYEDQLIREVISDLRAEQGWSEQYATQMVYNGGLEIYSCLVPEVQAAVDAVYQDLSNFQGTSSNGQQLQSAITIVDNTTGDIVAVAGGVGEKTGSLTLNRALSQRQPGSAIKPLAVYAPALEAGAITPATVVDDSPYSNEGTNGAPWPSNVTNTYRGLTTVYTAVEDSINTVAVKVLSNYITPQVAFDFLIDELGFDEDHLVVERTTSDGRVLSDIGPAQLALGGLTDGVSTMEMAAAYSVFPRGGVYIEPRTYSRVLRNDGTVLLDNTQESHVAMKDSTAWYINYMLQNVMVNGSGTRARFSGMTMAGKTGTTSNRIDLYFVGYTPYYTAAVWSGYDIQERMSSSLQQQSANTWRLVMSRIHEGLEDKRFPEPSAGLVQKEICIDSGLTPGDACRNDPRGDRTITLTFVSGDAPTGFCDIHTEQEVCTDDPILDENGEPTGLYHLAGEFCPAESRQIVSLLNYTREGVSASVSVQDNAYTLSHMTALGTCTVHTTAQEAPPEESGETVRQEIDPFDPSTWPGPEDFQTTEDWENFNPFDPSTWPEAYQDQEPSLPPEGGETGDTEAPPETEEPVEQPVESEEPYVPAA
ncbi:transglycosylase domain-containing protein [uncultured Intestinimonas sp.]|uniref:transglycosylase domain-containing protein n=1 Tax=uncultured Intestinimonas sp. TaxID=1689265 RepID=UPI00260BFFEF|nr:PBP1A family penicillin-binding protein [uncultured Intestinimonas sp.]